VYIDSSRRDTLRYEWPIIRCCHLLVWQVFCLWLEGEDGYGYGYIIMITVFTLTLMVMANVLLVYACSSLLV
jgi:hypothetical protein